MDKNNRRQFLKQSTSIALALPAITSFNSVLQDVQYPKILFRFGWDVKNNEDLAFIPSLYRLGQRSILGTEFYVWLQDTDDAVMEMFKKNFTNLKIITGEIDESGQPTTDELKTILSEVDLFFYSPGAANHVNWSNKGDIGIETRSLQFCLENNIPYALIGLGEIPEGSESLEKFLKIANSAKFIYSTSSYTNKILKEKDIKISKLKELPNPMFAFDLRDDTKSRKILESYKLLNKDFLTIDFKTQDLSEDKVKEYSEKIAALITLWVEETDKHVLILPNNLEDIELTMSHVYNPLSSLVKAKVVFSQEKLLPDVAASIYEKSRVVSGMSLFPVCTAIHSKIPVFFLTSMDLSSSAQTIDDMGLKNSIKELDGNTSEELSDVLLEINSKYVAGIIESDKAREYAIKKLLLEFEDINKFINKVASKKEDSKKKDKKKKNES